MIILVGLISSLWGPAAFAEGTWFCEGSASEKRDRILTSCGVDTDPTEYGARKKALAAAFEELDSICDRSVDCKSFELEIEPMRSECKKDQGGYKCYRAVRATITDKKRRDPYQKGASLKPEREKLDITVKLDARELTLLTRSMVPGTEASVVAQCKSDVSALAKSLLDISTQSKQSEMVQEAVKIPFEGGCAAIHYKVISVLARNGLEFPAYTAFLLDTLDGLGDPAADERAYVILEYFQKIGPMDEKKWGIAFGAIRRASTQSLYRLMPRIFFDQATGDTQVKNEKRRVDLVAGAMQKQEVGKPLPLKFDEGMDLLLRSLRSYRTRAQPWLAAYAYEKHQGSLQLDSPGKTAKSLVSLYHDVEDPALKGQINTWLAELVKKATPSYELSKVVDSHLRGFENGIKSQDDEEDDGIRKIKLYKALRTDFIARSVPNLGKNLAITDREYERRERMLLCLDLQIACEDLVPDTERLAKLLKSKKAAKRFEALDVLEKSPKVAKQLEDGLLDCLREADQGEIENSSQVLGKTVMALAAIPTRNSDALKLMVDLHMRSRLSFQDVRGQLGASVEPYLLKELQSKNERQHMALLMELQEYKHLSPATCSYLETLAQKKDPYFIKDGAEKALKRCH